MGEGVLLEGVPDSGVAVGGGEVVAFATGGLFGGDDGGVDFVDAGD